MTRKQAINYLSNSGFSMIQVETIVRALSTLSEVDFKELKDRYGDEVEYVVRDMVSGENLRWVELPRPKKQEPTIKALGEELRKARKGIADEKVLIGYNMAVAICNKHLGESEVER